MPMTMPSRPAVRGRQEPIEKPKLRHRSDIDGLRAIAVLPVVFYHARILNVPGGFVGVDIFFVISGYLITSLILKDLQKDRFSIAKFYERRARRILPALFTVLGITSVAAYAILFPEDIKQYGHSLTATLCFISNILFARHTGYFDTPSEMKPLLHTWSLAVEEQFYIVYPLFLFVITRYFRKRYVFAIASAFVISLAFSIYQIHSNPISAFYLAPGRAWELMVGGFIALNVIPAASDRLATLLGLLGLSLIAFSVFIYSDTTPFPGFSALLPCIGAGLIIYTGASRRSLVSKILSNPLLVFVGLISYSLYLWHWVLLVLARYYLVRPLTQIETSGVIAAASLIAVLSWKFIENPVRRRTFATRKWIFASAAMGVLPFAAFAGFDQLTGGFPGRYTGEVRTLLDASNDNWRERDQCAGKICRIGAADAPESFILWGDSHAGAAAPALEQIALTNHMAGAVAYEPSCAPLLNLKRYDGQYDCTAFNRSVLQYIRSRGINKVLMEGRWALYSEGIRYRGELGRPALLTRSLNPQDNCAEFEKLLFSTLAELKTLNVKVVLVASTPEVGIDVPTALARELKSGMNFPIAPTRAEFLNRQQRAFNVLKSGASQYSIELVYPHRLLCNDSYCSVIDSGHPLYSDDNHLSIHGTMLLKPIFHRVLLTE